LESTHSLSVINNLFFIIFIDTCDINQYLLVYHSSLSSYYIWVLTKRSGVKSLHGQKYIWSFNCAKLRYNEYTDHTLFLGGSDGVGKD